ncbi:MAG: alcohol dehydrogenase catalytic domain-containing protein [Planctomycetes bacterium]|nr:alcohol dehydrogenase catalytic domain-containing protein [Planctomycetota bacterium]
MKALVYTAPRRVEIREMDQPRPGPGEALIRVQTAGICGSDMSGFLGHSTRRRPPLILGHEVAGRVEAIEGPGFQPGERVCINPLFACLRCENCLAGRQNLCRQWRLLGMDNVQGAFAEWVLAPIASLVSIPEDLPEELAAMPEPLANGVHLLSMASPRPFGVMAIFGAGTQGTLILCLAKALGYREIYVVDINGDRLAIAAKLGARWMLFPRSIRRLAVEGWMWQSMRSGLEKLARMRLKCAGQAGRCCSWGWLRIGRLWILFL